MFNAPLSLRAGNNYIRIMPTTRFGSPCRGCSVLLTADGRQRVKTIDAGSGYLCQMEPVAHFGLGRSTSLPTVLVTWPDGATFTIPSAPINQIHKVVYPNLVVPLSASVTAAPLKVSTPAPIALALTASPLRGPQNVVELAVATSDLSTLVTAVTAADLAGALSGAGPFTVFAPTNAAFAAVPKADLDDLLKPENKVRLQGVLQYHVISGSIKAGDLKDSQVVKTLSGLEVTIVKRNGAVYVNDAKVVTADVIGSNGVVHIVDKVILPPAAGTAAQTTVKTLSPTIAKVQSVPIVTSDSSLTRTSVLGATAILLLGLLIYH
jgi:uncharacterized surface protein with fasciclin (FAS1) repeats